MAALATMKRRHDVSEFDCDVYENATARIPLAILSRAVARVLQSQDWFPTIRELLAQCEAVRVEMRSLEKFEPCANCGPSGWAEVLIDGVRKVQRCSCWRIHQERVQKLGLPEQPLALPAASEGEA